MILRGTMPNDSVTVKCSHGPYPIPLGGHYLPRRSRRNAIRGGRDVSGCRLYAGNGSFRTSALIDDGSEQGAENGYTPENIDRQKLMP